MKYQYQQLVEEAKKGEKKAMEELIGHLQPLIYSAIGRYGKGLEKDDVYQDACIILMESVQSYDPGRNVPFLSYIKSKMYYGIFNQSRKQKFHVSIDQPFEEGGRETLGDVLEDVNAWVDQQAIRREELEKLGISLNCLTSKQKQVILLHYFSGVKLKDIARIRGVHYKTVLRLKERAIKTMRDVMEESSR